MTAKRLRQLETATIASRIFEPESGAAAFRLAALRDALENSGITVRVLTTHPPHARIPSTDRVRRWPVLRDKTGAVRGYMQYASFDIPLFFRLVFHKTQLVIVEPPPTTALVVHIVCAIRRLPYVYFAADVISSAAAGIGVNRVVVFILRRLESWVMKHARLVLAVSPGVVHEVVALGVKPTAIALVGTGIDTTRFSDRGEAIVLGTPYFVYAGTMSEIHGAQVFVAAFANILPDHPDAKLIFLGQGTEERQIRDSAADLPDGTVDFKGVVGGEEAARWFRGATASLASIRPGRGYDFAFATKALASISCGTPVIYAGAGVTREVIIKNDLGWAVEWNADQVAAAMRSSLEATHQTHDHERISRWVKDNMSGRRAALSGADAIKSMFQSLLDAAP
jgi:glycosyltransferase involved in cell wall biosynthesis